ncbi:MAG: hypothetical protein ACI9N9_000395 [Enterobacterales bacterium]|jgi:hypothetical protein
MTIFIFTFAAFMLLVGLIIIINPVTIFNLLRKNSEQLWLYVIAVLIRLLLGALLVYQAGASKFPQAIEILGWIVIVAAIVFILIGRQKFIQLISWATPLVKPFGRVAGILALGFGTFLIYAFL